ncbi:hypothetical protein C7999DRAFT_44976 [Corynascus novoguineensis]|uniref:Aminoglycoside phosphotransferase domain-containing protein n=1 Tax=Corynascus novoguineensis TaxID=1126955 RepID=A0AAN7HAZ4_9PEZI|nr:hypothetical protein C7999DRAFT_44976 [Corynascus novoguineensis]
MLGAFLTPELRDRLLFDAEKDSYDRVENHWLLRKSAAAAFAQGYFSFLLKILTGGLHYPPILDKVKDFRRASFIDSSSSNVNVPNRWVLEILSRFATPLRWTYIAREIDGKQRKQSYAAFPTPFSSTLTLLSDACAVVLKTVWLLVPGNMRIPTYRSLASLGARMYGFTDSPNVQQLPFGLYLKMVSLARRESLVNEHATLELVRRHTNVPVPHALDLISDSSDIYLLTTRIPGYKLGLSIDAMSDEDTATLVHDLRRHIIALRAIPRPLGWKHAISNAVDGPCFDYRINAALNYDEDRGEVVGPFLSEDDFNDTLRCGALPEVVHHGGHKMVFTHGDLNLRNVLYWDYTKAYLVTKLHRRWLRMVDDMFDRFGDFEHELEIERELWDYCF